MTHPVEQPPKAIKEKAGVGRKIADDIAHSLHHRASSPGTMSARIEDRTKRLGTRVYGALKKRPSVGVLVFGGLAIAAADAIGVGELIMGLAIGYGAWQVLREGKSVQEAIREAERVERI